MKTFASSVLAASIGALLVVVGLFIYGNAIGRDITHEDLQARLTVIEFELRFQSCVLRVPSLERTEATFTECARTALVD